MAEDRFEAIGMQRFRAKGEMQVLSVETEMPAHALLEKAWTSDSMVRDPSSWERRLLTRYVWPMTLTLKRWLARERHVDPDEASDCVCDWYLRERDGVEETEDRKPREPFHSMLAYLTSSPRGRLRDYLWSCLTNYYVETWRKEKRNRDSLRRLHEPSHRQGRNPRPILTAFDATEDDARDTDVLIKRRMAEWWDKNEQLLHDLCLGVGQFYELLAWMKSLPGMHELRGTAGERLTWWEFIEVQKLRPFLLGLPPTDYDQIRIQYGYGVGSSKDSRNAVVRGVSAAYKRHCEANARKNDLAPFAEDGLRLEIDRFNEDILRIHSAIAGWPSEQQAEVQEQIASGLRPLFDRLRELLTEPLDPQCVQFRLANSLHSMTIGDEADNDAHLRAAWSDLLDSTLESLGLPGKAKVADVLHSGEPEDLKSLKEYAKPSRLAPRGDEDDELRDALFAMTIAATVVRYQRKNTTLMDRELHRLWHRTLAHAWLDERNRSLLQTALSSHLLKFD